MKQTIELKDLGLCELSLDEVRDTGGGNPYAVGLGIWIGLNTIAYSMGFAAHALYDAVTD